MSSFFLVKKENNQRIDAIKSLFHEQGFSEIRHFSFQHYELLFCDKLLVETPLFIHERDCSIFVSGTLLYKDEQDMQSGIRLLYQDLRENQLDRTALLGTFCILFFQNDQVSLLLDASGIQNVYYNTHLSALSSSFLAITHDEKGKLSANKYAMVETICTGKLIGPETIFNEVRRVERNDIPTFEHVQIAYVPRQEYSGTAPSSFDSSVDEQINRLENYFTRVKPFANREGVDSGLTGGYDSRLLFSLMKKFWNNYFIHSYFRKVKTRELIIAETIAEKTKENLRIIEAIHPLSMTPEEFIHTLNESCLFYDGHIRMHSYWTEEYNTREYRTKVLGEKRIGISGIGGEQYRNMEGLYLSAWSLDSFVKYDMLLFSCGNIFDSTETLNTLSRSIQDKIRKGLGDPILKEINLKTLKKYLAEVFIPAKLGARNNAENKISYFISPYTDPYVSDYAYRNVRFLGVSNSFQAKMISKISSEIASITSDYGYNFNEGEPFKLKLRKLLYNLTPKSIRLRALEKHPKMNDIQAWNRLVNKHPVCMEYYNMVKSLDLPIRLEVLVKRVDLMPLVLGLGFLLSKTGFNKNHEA